MLYFERQTTSFSQHGGRREETQSSTPTPTGRRTGRGRTRGKGLVNPKEKGKDEPEKNEQGDIRIKRVPKLEIKNMVFLTKTAKVALTPKFRRDLAKLKEFITKLQIYILYNSESFDYEPDKVLFTISYLEGLAFDFIEVYLNNYNNNTYFSRMC